MLNNDENCPSGHRPKRWYKLLILVAVMASVIVVASRNGVRFFEPPIASGIYCFDPLHCGEASRALTHILLRRFPLGTHEDVLRSALTAQGFRSLPSSISACVPRGKVPPIGIFAIDCPAWDPEWNPRNYLAYGWGWHVCGHGVNVMWSSDKAGRITHLEGHYDYTCL